MAAARYGGTMGSQDQRELSSQLGPFVLLGTLSGARGMGEQLRVLAEDKHPASGSYKHI